VRNPRQIHAASEITSECSLVFETLPIMCMLVTSIPTEYSISYDSPEFSNSRSRIIFIRHKEKTGEGIQYNSVFFRRILFLHHHPVFCDEILARLFIR
jgi:hypothetical protein